MDALKLKFIGRLIEKKVISPSLGRIIEISIISSTISLLTWVGTALQSGDWSDYKVALGAFLVGIATGIVAGIQKALREIEKDLASNKQ